MSLKRMLEQIEHFLPKHPSAKLRKNYRNRWLRRHKITEIPNTKIRKGWEY